MSARPRILFYVLHLLGVGHLYRAQRLIDGFARHGMAVDLTYGGEPVDEIKFAAESIHYLSPISAVDSTYSDYIDADKNPLTEAYQKARAEEIAKAFAGLNPDIILIEAFPFGRRMIRHEMRALLDAAKARRPRPIVVCSLRDILQERKKPGRMEETCEWIDNYFDHVLVHSDPEIIALDETFPHAGQISNKISYSGFVVPSGNPQRVESGYDVLVSAGGGAFGGALMTTALALATQSDKQTWCLSTGPNLAADQIAALNTNCPAHVTIVRHLPELAEHMKLAKVSISQCGYNTAMDVLAAHRDSACRAVFVPFDTQGQSEQLRRAELLEKAGYAVNLPQSRLSTASLKDAMEQARKLKIVRHEINFEGVENSALLLKKWLRHR